MAFISPLKYTHITEIWLLYRTQSMNTVYRIYQTLLICSLRAGESHEMSGISKFPRSALPQDTAVQSQLCWFQSRFLVLSCCVTPGTQLIGHLSLLLHTVLPLQQLYFMEFISHLQLI